MAQNRKEREYREIEIDVTSIGSEGVSVGRVEDVVHFVKGALPGERVRAVVRKKHRRYVEAETLEVLSPAPERIVPPCPHFGTCGGCSWQHLEYHAQVAWKSSSLHDAMHRIGGLAEVPLLSPLAAKSFYGYRNKMEFSFSASPWLTDAEINSDQVFDRTFALGLHVPGRYDKVRHIDHCALQHAEANALLARVHELPNLRNVSAYDHRAHEGFLRHLVIRSSATTGAVMGILITTTPESEVELTVVDEWMNLHGSLPAGSTLIHAVNDTHSPVANGTIELMVGPGYLEETTHDVNYRISPFSFFQTNTEQMHVLVALGLDAARLTPDDVAWDLYCGTGTLTLPAARKARHVVGAELVQSSIDDAVTNAARNNIRNVELHALDLHSKHAIAALRDFPQPDVIIIDPPRSGMHPQVVEHILAVTPPRIAYVSCNPATLARDYSLLAEQYAI